MSGKAGEEKNRAATVSGLQLLSCPLEDRRPALEVLYQGLPGSLRACLVDEMIRDGQGGRVDLSGLWIARRQGWGLATGGGGSGSGRIVAALMTQAVGGRAVAFWPPEVNASWRRGAIAGQLVREALAVYRARGFAIAQAVLDATATARNAADLTRGGMPHVTDLVFLRRDTTRPMALPDSDRRLEWRGLDEVGADAFRTTLQATYEGSLDMPELEGVRSMDDTLEGHRGAGRFAAERWRLGQAPGRPDEAAVLLLAPAADHDAWEVVYLGLTPAARGKGLGARVLAHALDLARPHARSLELAVDVRNRPAARLYGKTGFSPVERRTVHLAVL